MVVPRIRTLANDRTDGAPPTGNKRQYIDFRGQTYDMTELVPT
jgi:hypothetical protein